MVLVAERRLGVTKFDEAYRRFIAEDGGDEFTRRQRAADYALSTVFAQNESNDAVVDVLMSDNFGALDAGSAIDMMRRAIVYMLGSST